MSSAASCSSDRSASTALANAVSRLKETNVELPQLAQLADPSRIPSEITRALAEVDPDAPHPLNLWRVHWYNDASRRGIQAVPAHLVLGPDVTGVDAPIVVLLGSRFPMIAAHKVLAAYGCLVPRLVSGEFDPTKHRALWPSTGNYCRGGVAISRILGCRGVAILPAGMSAERFNWLSRWVIDDSDIVRTPGTESNDDALLLPVPLQAGKTSVLTVEERKQVRRQVSLSAEGESLEPYLLRTKLPAELIARLRELARLSTERAKLAEGSEHLREQLADLTQRADELRESLRTVEKMASAAALARELLGKLQDASQKSEAISKQRVARSEAMAAASARYTELLRDLRFDEPAAP